MTEKELSRRRVTRDTAKKKRGEKRGEEGRRERGEAEMAFKRDPPL